MAAMYHPFVEALALTLVDVPFTFITTVLFSIILYFIIKLQQSAAQYLCVFPSLLPFTPLGWGSLNRACRPARSSCSFS